MWPYEGRDEEKLRKAETELGKHVGKLLVMQADVSNKSEVNQWVKGAVSQFGHTDVLVNNAYVCDPALVYNPLNIVRLIYL